MSSTKGKYQPLGTRAVPSKSKLGAIVRKCRIARGLNQTEFGALIGCTRGVISAIERGKYTGKCQLISLAKATGYDIKKLIKLVPEVEPITDLSKLVRCLRYRIGLTLRDLSSRSGISLKSLQRYDIDRKFIHYETAVRFSNALNVDVSIFQQFLAFNTKFVETVSPQGQLIRDARVALGLSLRDLAKRLDVSEQAISATELGKNGIDLHRSGRHLIRLAKILKLTPEQIESLEPKPKLRKVKPRSTSLGIFLFKCRQKHSLSIEQFAVKLEFPNAHIYRDLEIGKRRLKFSELLRIEEYLQCSIPKSVLRDRLKDG